MRVPREITRRGALLGALGLGALGSAAALARAARQPEAPAPAPGRREALFTISLAEWSLHRALKKGEMTNLDFPVRAMREWRIDAVEYVNSFFKDKARDGAYLRELKSRCDGEGVKSLLIMCDGEGALGDADEAARAKAVENHHRWVDAALALGCHSIRVNAASTGAPDEQERLAADGLTRLTEYAQSRAMNVIVENHGGLSSNGAWLDRVIRRVGNPRCGTLPDFGNFNVSATEKYDRYKGVGELMPHAKGVSAKSHAFDENGDETATDYRRMLRIVVDAGYRGYIGIEYEGDKHTEPEGIRLTKELLEKVRAELAAKAGP